MALPHPELSDLHAPALAGSASTLRLGHVPLADAAPLVVADALGLFAEAGLRVSLSAERSWAALRDKLAFGALDGAHLLAPMAIAAAAGLGGISRRLTVTASLARNGNTITLSHPLLAGTAAGAGPLDPAAFAAALQRRAEAGLPPPTIAIVFAFSSHNYLLRHWLAAGGIDPDHDLRLVVVPPPQVARALAEGAIEGFCAGEPWGSRAAAEGTGRIALATADIWPDHPEKVLAFAEGVAERDPEAVTAATAAILAAQRWLADPAQAGAAAALMQERVFPGLPPATVLGGPARLRFAAGASRPWPAEAAWWAGAMRRWGHLPARIPDAEALAAWRPDLWDAAARRLGEPIPQAPPSPPPACPPPLTPPLQPEETLP